MKKILLIILIVLGVLAGATYFFTDWFQSTKIQKIVSNSPINTTKSNPKKLEEVADLGIFIQDKVLYDQNENSEEKVPNPTIIKAKYKYYKFGLVPSGELKDYQVYLVETNTFFLAGENPEAKIFLLLATKDNKKYYVFQKKDETPYDAEEFAARFKDPKSITYYEFPIQQKLPTELISNKFINLKTPECNFARELCIFGLTDSLKSRNLITKLKTINDIDIYSFTSENTKSDVILADIDGLLVKFTLTIPEKSSDLGINNSKYKGYKLLTPPCTFDSANDVAKDFGSDIVKPENLTKISSDNEVAIFSINNLRSEVNKKLVDQIINQSYFDGQDRKPEIKDLENNGVLIIKDQFGIYRALVQNNLIWGGCGKPVVYLYPEKDTKVSLSFLNPIKFTNVIPAYQNSWEVLAEPNGNLKDLKPELTDCKSIKNNHGSEYAYEACTKNEYPYLYWSGNTQSIKYPTAVTGFIVKKENLNSFFNEKLSQMNFNQKEINDFKEYWVSYLSNKNSDYFRISFFQNNIVNEMFPINVNPMPKSTIRMFMDWDFASKDSSITEQKLISYPRTGFTLVEWGGLKK